LEVDMLASVGELPAYAAQRFGDRVALVIGMREFTFSDLDRLSGAFAHSLVKLGLAPGDRVTLFAPNSWEWIVSYYGALRAGAVINPINVMLTAVEVARVTQDCGTRFLICSTDKIGPLRACGVSGLTMIAIGADMVADTLPFDEVTANAWPFETVMVGASTTCAIGYTSGTTGHPKGAMQSHRAIMTNVAMTAQMHLKTDRDIVVSSLPCTHVYGNVVFQGAMLCGMKLILHPRFDTTEVLASLEAHRATLFEGVPTMYLYMLASTDLAMRDLSSLTRCTIGGQTMPAAKMREVEERFGCPLIELWGMTELAGLGTTFPVYGQRKLGSIGIPLPYCEAQIAGVADASKTMARGEVGELMIRGPIVMQGYWGNEKATREAIEPDGWLHTGDLASMDDDGAIFIVDRKKDMINTAGFKVFPAEIERVAAAHPGVAMVAVGGVPDDLKGEIAVAYVVLKPGASPDEAGILDLCRRELAAYKVPRAVRFVTDLPKTSTGKIMRRELSKLYIW
jgi:long-chain acyl-CoA synthetase